MRQDCALQGVMNSSKTYQKNLDLRQETEEHNDHLQRF